MPVFTKTLESAQLKSDAQQMASVLRMARQEAITSSQQKDVVFYPYYAKYKLGSKYYYLSSGTQFVGETNFDKKALKPTCSFLPSGALNGTLGGTVTLRNNQSMKYIIVDMAGRVRVSDEQSK